MSDLLDLPDIQLVPVDADEIVQSIISTYEAAAGRTLAPGDPVRIFLQAIASIIVQQRNLINDAAKLNLLRYARDEYLDQIGAYVETTRLDASAAIVTVRFMLSAIQSSAIPIPVGTRVTPGNNLFFATSSAAEIPAGSQFADVTCVCLEPGTIGNGYLPGQISTLVDPIPFVVSVSNTTTSSGGADVESDDAYRERIYTAPERFSVAGPSGAYQYWARTANAGIMDVHVHSPSPGEVNVVVLMQGGELPTQDILDAVYGVLNDKTVRPLTDLVTVSAPDAVNYAVNVEYWIDSTQATEVAAIQARVQQAVQDYVLWQKSAIGRDINPSELIKRIMIAGARRVEVNSPVYQVLGNTELAVIADPNTDITVTYGGLEDD